MSDKDLCSTCCQIKQGATGIKNTKQILRCITEALTANRPVFITDGTVTRKVILVELTDSDLAHGRVGTLDVRTEDGSWKQLPINWPWDEVTGCGLTEMGDGLYIAPDWWIAL